MRRGLLVLAMLAGCGREGAPPPATPTAVSFREAGRMIASTTRGGPADLAGDWVVSRTYPGPRLGGYVVPGATVRIASDAEGLGSWTLDPPGEGQAVLGSRSTGPGRYALGGPGLDRVWVLWVDDDFRTAVVGTPDGSFGWIMDRPGEASPDRTEAARRVLEFNGYDLARLEG